MGLKYKATHDPLQGDESGYTRLQAPEVQFNGLWVGLWSARQRTL